MNCEIVLWNMAQRSTADGPPYGIEVKCYWSGLDPFGIEPWNPSCDVLNKYCSISVNGEVCDNTEIIYFQVSKSEISDFRYYKLVVHTLEGKMLDCRIYERRDNAWNREASLLSKGYAPNNVAFLKIEASSDGGPVIIGVIDIDP